MGIAGTTAIIARAGLPLPAAAFWFAVVFETLGGLALVFGFRERPVLFGLAAWCLLTGLIFHHDIADRVQRDQLLKNIVMAAALIQIAARAGDRQVSLRSQQSV
jgi:putative oxidoreductase